MEERGPTLKASKAQPMGCPRTRGGNDLEGASRREESLLSPAGQGWLPGRGGFLTLAWQLSGDFKILGKGVVLRQLRRPQTLASSTLQLESLPRSRLVGPSQTHL